MKLNKSHLKPLQFEIVDYKAERFYANIRKINAIVTKICSISLILMPEAWF